MGINAANVVPVEAIIGKNILLAEIVYPSILDNPSDIFLSAYSVITIEPSINIPIPRRRPIMTRKFTSISSPYKIK